MPIPDYQTVMLPILEVVSDGREYNIHEIVKQISDRYNLSDDEQQQTIPSGTITTIRNRVGWAKTYLKKAGLLEQPKRGQIRISDEGKAVLSQGLKRIDAKWLGQYPSFVEFKNKKKDKGNGNGEKPEIEDEKKTPEERIDDSYQTLRAALADDLLEQIKAASPKFFEHLVVELLVAMGYGGSIEDAGQAIGKSGDGGIDGIIKEDNLGLDIVVVQAKRWDKGVVGRPAVQAFAGSMEPHRAKKGVFITASKFSKEAHEYVKQIERSIVLINGEKLCSLMIEHDVGVTRYRSYDLKRVDADYFDDQA